MQNAIETTNFLHGSRIRLTTLISDDTTTIAAWNQDVGYARFLNTQVYRPRNQASLQQWLEKVNDTPDEIHFAIRFIESYLLIGVLGFTGIEWTNQTAELYIGIGDRQYWGQGFGQDALSLAIQYGFCELNLHRIQMTVIAYNSRAIACYERLGFQREGIFRQFGLRDGRRYDMFLYGLLHDEWQK